MIQQEQVEAMLHEQVEVIQQKQVEMMLQEQAEVIQHEKVKAMLHEQVEVFQRWKVREIQCVRVGLMYPLGLKNGIYPQNTASRRQKTVS